MGIFVRASVRVSLAIAALALVALVGVRLRHPAIRLPAIRLAPTSPAKPPVQQAAEQPVEEHVDDAQRMRLLESYDAAALALMNRDDMLDDRELLRRLLVDTETDVEVYRLRENERLLVWDSPPPKIHGGGARASAFVFDGRTWRNAGHIDSASWTSFVWRIAIDGEQGIAYMVEDYDGNGAPPSRVVAFAVDGGSLISTSVEDVPRIDVDSTGMEPIVRLWWRVPGVNNYPDTPLRGSRWQVRRTHRGLVATETPNTPWIDGLQSFCAAPERSNASPAIRARVARCAGNGDIRWAAGKRLVVTLDLILHCPDGDSHISDGELRLAAKEGQWRVVEASSCRTPAKRP